MIWMEHKGYFVLVLLVVFSVGGTAMIDVMNWQEQAEYLFTLEGHEQEENLPTIEETISEMEESCNADIKIDNVELDIVNDIMIVEAIGEPKTKLDKAQDIQWVNGIGFAGASCTPTAICSGTNNEACAHYTGASCLADVCCDWSAPLEECSPEPCSSFLTLDTCGACSGCISACWTIIDNCDLTANTIVGGVFINTGGSLVHTAGTLTTKCFKKVAADASYYKKNVTAILKITGASCPC